MITAVVALDYAHGIGVRGGLPWRLPADLKRFRALTLGHPILMGRATHVSIGRALPGRQNLVLSGSSDWTPEPGITRVESLDEAIWRVGPAAELMVIGGASVYASLLDRFDRIVLTVIHGTFECDTFFPAIDLAEWEPVSREDFVADDSNAWAQSVWDLRRARRLKAHEPSGPGALAASLRG
jgi:dihydrofolate reductase